jgi:glycosyltransferase involved in cell wall biosynthesis
MKRVIFYTQNRWAFGSIHHALCKELYKYDIYCNVLDWSIGYTTREFELLIDKYDYFVTNPEAIMALHNEYKVPFDKIISIAHGQWDILLARQNFGLDVLSKIKKYAVVSNILKEKSIEFGSPVIPEVVELGIHFDLLYNKPSDSLKTIGYAGAYETVNYFGQEIKRGRLVKDIVEKTNLNLNNHEFFNYMCVPSYYKQIDCLIMSSTEESVGLPMLEGAAAGKLCIGTPVGYFERNGLKGGGIQVSLEENQFVDEVSAILNYYKYNPEQYHKKCLDIQEYARYNYDWSKVIDQWVKLF